jgi:hypothetical protein
MVIACDFLKFAAIRQRFFLSGPDQTRIHQLSDQGIGLRHRRSFDPLAGAASF